MSSRIRRSAAPFVVATLLVATSAPARAQTDRVLPTSLNLSSVDCGSDDEVVIQWTGYQKPDAYFLSVRLEERGVNTSGCPTFGVQAPLHVVEPFADELFAPTNGTLFVERSYTGDEILGPLCDDGVRREALLCVYGSSFTDTPGNWNDIDLTLPPLVVTLDTDVPDEPSITDITPGDRRLIVHVDEPDDSLGDTYTYLVQHRACPYDEDAGTSDDGGVSDDAGVLIEAAESLCDAEAPFRQTSGSSSPVTVGGLTNEREYEVRVVVKDDFGNESVPSEAVLATPLGELTPLGVYDGSDNPFSIEGPTCGSSHVVLRDGPSAVGLVALALLVVRRRRVAHEDTSDENARARGEGAKR